ncbi:MAG: M56 family metallopeptidase [Candidatus Latescibacterota bacterium]
METSGLVDRLIEWSNLAMPILANLMLSSTVLGGIGLLGARILKRRGAASQSLFLRLSLLAVLCTPVTALVLSSHGARVIQLPLARVERPAIKDGAFRGELPRVEPAGGNAVQNKVDAVPRAVDPPVAKSGDIPLVKGDKREKRNTPTLPAAPFERTVIDRGKEENQSALPADFLPWLYVSFSLSWLVLSLFLFIRAIFHNLSIQYLLFTARKAHPAHVNLSTAIADQLNVKPPRVLQSSHVRRAFLAGFLHPAIVLPLHENEVSMSSREVFLHEFAHLIRRDHLWNLVCQMGKVILPLQPLIWLLARQIEITGEYVCDDYVVVHGRSDRGYARQLYTMAERLQCDREATPAGVGIFSVRSYLFSRIDRILDRSLTRSLKTKLHEALSFVVLFLSSMALTGFFSFKGEALKRKAGNGESRYTESETAASLKAVRSERHKASVETSDLPADSGQNIIVLPVRQGEIYVPRENENPDDDSFSGREKFMPEETVSPSVLLASLRNEPGSEISSAELVDSIDQPPATVLPDDIIPGTKQSIPLVSVPDSTALHPKKAAETPSRNVHLADLHELRAAAIDRGEPLIARTGPLEIAVPETLTGALRESLEQGQENPVWSPTGKAIAFTGNRGRGIWVVSVSGEKPVLLCDNTGNAASGKTAWKSLARALCFTPDGNELTFVNYSPVKKNVGAAKEAVAGALTPDPVIERVNLMTGERKTIIEGAMDGCWSGDGRHFVYVESDMYGLGIIDAATGKRRIISTTGFSPTLTHDGASIIYVDQAGYIRNQLFRVSLSGGEPEQLTEDGNWWEPECSPDGEWVLSTGNAARQYETCINFRAFNLCDRRTYDVMVFSDDSAGIGSWSPTGRQFCYTRTQGVFQDGYNIQRSTIHIENFMLGSASKKAEAAKPLEFKLVGNFPNPFNPSTTIRFTIPSAGPAELIIFNMMGQKIRELVSGPLEAGEHSIVWNGRDRQHRPVSSGTYVARLRMEGKVETRRMTLVK